MCFHLLCLHRESEHPAGFPGTGCYLRWSQTSGAITCAHKVDITVENIVSGPPAFQTAGEVSVVSGETDHSLHALHAPPSPVDVSDFNHRAAADALASSPSRISVDTASTIAGADRQTWNALRMSASTSLTRFAESVPACLEGRLIPPPILVWLRSRLSTEEKGSASTVLTVAWWQPILMRMWSLDSMSSVVNYRLHPNPSTSYSKTASRWWTLLTKNPSPEQIDQICGKYRLVYLRTTNVSTVGKLKSSLRRHYTYRHCFILAIFPFAENLWEVLIEQHYLDQFIACAKACDYTVEKDVLPGHPVGYLSNLRSSFWSCLRARERLIARASIAQLLPANNQIASCAVTVYRDLVKLYRCYDAYNTVVSILLATDQPLYSPGWSCMIGFFQCPAYEPATGEHCK